MINVKTRLTQMFLHVIDQNSLVLVGGVAKKNGYNFL